MKQTLKIEKYKKALFTPLNIIIIYLFASILLYFFGPIKWNIDNGLLLFSYVSINYICIWLGYRRMMRRAIYNEYGYWCYDDDDGGDEIPYYSKLFTCILLFTIVCNLTYSFFEYGGISIDRILNMAQSYLNNRDFEATHNIFTRIFTYLWGLNYFYLPCGIVLYKRLKILDKVLFWIALLTNIFFWLSIGTMKGLGDILITAIVPFIVVTVKGKIDAWEVKKALNKRKYTLLILGILFAIVFGYSALNRYILRGHNDFSALNTLTRPFAKEEILWPFPYITNSIIAYVSHGYTGLAYALKLPFKWTFFVGNSRALTNIIERKLLDGSNVISSITYVQRLQDVYGWKNGSIWPTAFTWLASDFSFILLPALMFFMGYFWAKCIYEALVKNNVISLVMASYLSIFFFYLPCNNQILQSERSFWAMILITILYLNNTSRRPLALGKRVIRF